MFETGTRRLTLTDAGAARWTTGGTRPGVRALLDYLRPHSGADNAIPALDGLRAMAVLLTILFHSWRWEPGMLQPGQNAALYPIYYGRTGVQLFFVLSGFLLFLPYARWLFGLGDRPRVLAFYRRRILRVCPAYWISLALLTLLGPLTSASIRDALVHAAFIHNAWTGSIYSINGVFWTMAIEVQFYALLPLIGWVAGSLAPRIGAWRAAGVVVLGLVALSLGNVLIAHHTALRTLASSAPALVGESSLPHWLGVFGAGIACSVLYVYLTQVLRLRRRHARRLRLCGGVVLAAGVAGALALAFVPELHYLHAKEILFGWSYAAVLFGVLFGQPAVQALLSLPLLRGIGLVSYSLYIWHTVVLGAVLPHLRSLPSTELRVALGFALAILLSVPVAYLSFQLTERPFFTARRHARRAIA